MPNFIKWMLARIEEPSTWAGTGVVAIVLKNSGLIDSDLADHLLAAGAAIGAILAIVLPEKKASDKSPVTK